MKTENLSVLGPLSGRCLGAYLACSQESSRQHGIAEFLTSRGASFLSNAQAESRFGETLGFDYPLDSVDSITGGERSDWGLVPRWECDDSDLVVLLEFKNLRELRICGKGISDTGLKTVGSLTILRDLEVCGSSITDAGTPVLVQMANLEHLDLSGNRIGNKTMNYVAKLSNISSLQLSETDATELGIAKLVELPKLKRLIIGDLPVRDGAFRNFGGLRELEYIFMNGALITDASMDDLKNVRSLKTLNIHRCNVSSSAVIRFKDAIPECNVIE